ncbi:MAG: hypothetical protein EHM13_05140, partial [Acidobacteria bacterium]
MSRLYGSKLSTLEFRLLSEDLMRYHSLPALILLVACASTVAVPVAASRPPTGASSRSVPATPLSAASAARVNGSVSEEAWQEAPAITEFVQRDPHEGNAPTCPTEARVLYDTDALYVSVRARDPEPEKIVGFL